MSQGYIKHNFDSQTELHGGIAKGRLRPGLPVISPCQCIVGSSEINSTPRVYRPAFSCCCIGIRSLEKYG
jgi:hypothetical protein